MEKDLNKKRARAIYKFMILGLIFLLIYCGLKIYTELSNFDNQFLLLFRVFFFALFSSQYAIAILIVFEEINNKETSLKK